MSGTLTWTRTSRPFSRSSLRDYLLLFALSGGPRHGYGLVKDVERDTAGEVTIDPANLYRSIKRLTKDGLVAEADDPGEATAAERRRYYRHHPAGDDVWFRPRRPVWPTWPVWRRPAS